MLKFTNDKRFEYILPLPSLNHIVQAENHGILGHLTPENMSLNIFVIRVEAIIMNLFHTINKIYQTYMFPLKL